MIEIIANPIAGGGRGRAAAERLADALRRRGRAVALHLTTRAGDAERIAAGVATAEAVVVVGGDGSINEVLNGLPDPALPLGVLPMGTANVLACELRLPRRVEDAARVIDEGHTVGAAIGIANGRRFLLFCGAGLDGRIVRRVEEVRRGRLGKLRWTGPILHTIRRWPCERLTVCADGEAWAGDFGEVLVTRVRNYGGVMALPGGIAIDDGMLHVLAFPQRTRWQYFVLTLRAICGRLRVGRDCVHAAARSVRITAAGAGADYQVDGDLGGRAPIAVELAGHHAGLIAPRPT